MTQTVSTGRILCNTCRFWDGAEHRAGACRRHAPSVGETSYQIARWPETRGEDGCGEGETHADAPAAPRCEACAYWDKPGLGIDPAQRGDRYAAWWRRAGWCRRFAPRPGVEIGERGFWRATHAEDFCHDGHPGEAPGQAESPT